MTEENESSLFVAKLMASPRKKREELLKLIFKHASRKDQMIEFLDHKKAYCPTKKLTDGDKFWMSVSASSYPTLNESYYTKKKMISEQSEVLVKLQYINPVTGYFAISAIWGNDTVESIHEVYPSYVPTQDDLLEL